MTPDARDAEGLSHWHCGCGDYAIPMPDGKDPLAIDIVCPECGNHFGYDVRENCTGDENRRVLALWKATIHLRVMPPLRRIVQTAHQEKATGGVRVTEKPYHPRRFELVRTEDVSGTSGRGVVAVGVEYPDGAVHMQWRNAENDSLTTDSNGVSFKPAPDGIAATEEIHGHNGRTEVKWIDD